MSSLSVYTVNQPPNSAPPSVPHDAPQEQRGMGLRTHKSRAFQTPRIIYVRQIHHCQTAGPTNSDTASAPISGRVQTSSRMHCNGWKEPRKQNLAYCTLATKLIFGHRDITRWLALEDECGMIREWCRERLLQTSYLRYTGRLERRIVSLIPQLESFQHFHFEKSNCFLRWVEDAFRGSANSITEDSRRLTGFTETRAPHLSTITPELS
jgi:hypothetical protein